MKGNLNEHFGKTHIRLMTISCRSETIERS